MVSFELESGDGVIKVGNGVSVVISTPVALGKWPAWAAFACLLVLPGAALLCVVVGVVSENSDVIEVLIAVGGSVELLADAVADVGCEVVAELGGAAVAPWGAFYVGNGFVPWPVVFLGRGFTVVGRVVLRLWFCCCAMTFGGGGLVGVFAVGA